MAKDLWERGKTNVEEKYLVSLCLLKMDNRSKKIIEHGFFKLYTTQQYYTNNKRH